MSLLDAFGRLEEKFDPHELRDLHGRWTKGNSLADIAKRARADESSASGRGPGYGIVAARAIRRGDHRDHPLPEGKYPAGDPRNDPSYEAYTREVDTRIKAAKSRGEFTEARYGAKRNGKPLLDGDGKVVYTAARRAEHDRIIDRIMTAHADVPSDRQALMLGGLPGAGKSSYLSDYGNGAGGFLKVNGEGEPTNAIVINPDEMKTLLLAGRYLQGNPLVPRTPGLTDGEHAAIVHEESSHLAMMLAQRALNEGKNVVFDITLGDAKKANEKYLHNGSGNGAVDLGYDVHHVFVEGDMATSLHRAGLRHKHLDESSGQRTYSGRYVELNRIQSEANSTGALDSDGRVAKSKNRVESDKLIAQRVFKSAVRYDNKEGKVTKIL